jgi:hypothetical protein
MLGDECARKVQLQYMKHDANFSGQNLRTFEIGSHMEELIADWIRGAGFKLRTRGGINEQFGFSIAGGKIAGHCDGIIFDGPYFCKYPCLWECKTMNNRPVAKVELWLIMC